MNIILIVGIVLLVSQGATASDSAECTADVLVLLDASGSVVNEFEHEVAMLRAFADALPEITTKFRMALIIYHAHWEKEQWTHEDWTQFGTKGQFVQRVARIQHDGKNHGTSTGAALQDAITMFRERKQVKSYPAHTPIMLVITDGNSRMKSVRTAMDTIKEMRINTIAVGVNTYVNESNLHEHANPPDQVVVNRDGGAAAMQAIAMLRAFAQCPEEGGVSSSSAPPLVTWLNTGGGVTPPATVTGRPVTAPATLPAGGNQCNADILVVLDASGSTRTGFNKELSMLREFARALPEFTDTFRIALIRYSGQYQKIGTYGWGTFGTKAEFAAGLDSVPFMGATTYTGRALGEQGALRLWSSRGDVRNTPVLVSVTDGVANDPKAVADAMAHMDNMGVTSVAVGVTEHAHRGELKAQALPADNVIVDADERRAAKQLLAEVVRTAGCD